MVKGGESKLEGKERRERFFGRSRAVPEAIRWLSIPFE